MAEESLAKAVKSAQETARKVLNDVLAQLDGVVSPFKDPRFSGSR